MKKISLLALAILAIFVSSCDFKPKEITDFENSEYIDESFIDSIGPKVDHEFVFADGDTIVGDYYMYVRYIPFDSVKPDHKVVTGKYVRYHNTYGIGLVFKRDYIYDICMRSHCVYREVFDTINELYVIKGLDTIRTPSLVREYYFPEAGLGFAIDTWEESIVYSYIYFDKDFWYSSIDEDDITVTSDIESVLWNVSLYLNDSVQASVNIFKYDEQGGLELDYTKRVKIQLWDIIRCFNTSYVDGLKKEDIIVYTNEDDFIFVRPIGSDSNHLKAVYFSGYIIDNPSSLEMLESYFMTELDKIPVRDDDFIEPYEEP